MSYRSIKDDSHLVELLRQLACDHPREGFWKFHHRIRNSGTVVNHKRLHRVYGEMQLPLRRKHKKRLPARVKERLDVPASFTHTWSVDFMSDATIGARKFRSFNVIDDFNREVLFIETDYSIKSSRVIWVLRHLVSKHGKPTKIRMDNGPEFMANLARNWSEANDIEFKYIQPGKPSQNAYIERFNRSYREGVLDSFLFSNLDEVREATALWVADYNNLRPHEALGNLPPVAYRKAGKKTEGNTFPALRFAPATPSLHSRGESSELIKLNKL